MNKITNVNDSLFDALTRVSDKNINKLINNLPPESSYPFELSIEFRVKIQYLLDHLRQEEIALYHFYHSKKTAKEI